MFTILQNLALTLLVLTLTTAVASAGAIKESAGTVKGVCAEPQTSEEDALRFARRNAAEALLPKLRNVTRTAVSRQSSAGVVMPNDEILKQVIAAEIDKEEMLREKSVDRQQKDYGAIYNIYYASVLIDASPKQLDRMANRAIEIAHAGTKRTVSAAASGTALVAVIALVYFAANALTRGYYQWRLRLLAAAGSVAGIAAVTGLFFGL